MCGRILGKKKTSRKHICDRWDVGHLRMVTTILFFFDSPHPFCLEGR